jgi:hypothetical protein
MVTSLSKSDVFHHDCKTNVDILSLINLYYARDFDNCELCCPAKMRPAKQGISSINCLTCKPYQQYSNQRSVPTHPETLLVCRYLCRTVWCDSLWSYKKCIFWMITSQMPPGPGSLALVIGSSIIWTRLSSWDEIYDVIFQRVHFTRTILSQYFSMKTWVCSADKTLYLVEVVFCIRLFSTRWICSRERAKSHLIGWRQTLTSSAPNHIHFLLVHVEKIAKCKTGSAYLGLRSWTRNRLENICHKKPLRDVGPLLLPRWVNTLKTTKTFWFCRILLNVSPLCPVQFHAKWRKRFCMRGLTVLKYWLHNSQWDQLASSLKSWGLFAFISCAFCTWLEF